LTKSLP